MQVVYPHHASAIYKLAILADLLIVAKWQHVGASNKAIVLITPSILFIITDYQVPLNKHVEVHIGTAVSIN